MTTTADKKTKAPEAIKPGYKHTPLGWIPKEWENKTIEDICKNLVRGPFGGSLKKEFFVHEGYKVYEQKNAIYKNVETGNYFIDENKYNELKRFSVSVGDFIISCSGSIGKIFKIPEDAPKGVINQALLKISCNEKVIPDFFYYCFEWDSFQKRMIDNSQGGAMQNLVGMDIFRQIAISIPPLPEQTKIAAILSTWDDAIQKTQQLITQLQERNKGLAQQLLTGKKRLKGFKGEWKEIHLHDAFAERNETKHHDLPLLSITGDRGVIPQTEADKRDISNNDKSKYKRICIDDIGYNTMRMWQGRSALSTIEGIVSPAYTILKPKKAHYSSFYEKLFKQEFMINKFYRNSQGLVSDTWNCKYKDFGIIKALVPGYEEQQAIANVLDKASEELKQQEQYLAALQQQKKGLMQKLLTGEVRVKV